MTFSRESELRQSTDCSGVLSENEFLLVVPQSQECGVARVKLQRMVGVLVRKPSHPPFPSLRLLRVSITLYLEVKGKIQAFFLLKVPYLYFVHVANTFLCISSADIFHEVTSL